MDELTRYLNPIRSAYPNLRLASARAIDGAGQHNDVVIVNEAIVFRFPRAQEGLQRLPPAVAILRALQGRTMLPVPRPIYRSKEWRMQGEAFTGYPLLAGAPLTAEAIEAIHDEATLRDLASQLAHFLRELHSVPQGMIDITLPPLYGASYWRQMYQEIQEKLFPAMAPGARGEVAAHFETYLTMPAAFDYTPVLIHGDFGAGNILWDPETLEITGVIDFDAAGWSDPAIDIAAISCLSENLSALMIEASPDMAAIRQRAEFYRGAFAPQEALQGLRHNDRIAYECGMSKLTGIRSEFVVT
jgi:aminoglycoside 2''-phosphotransferase